MRWSSRSCTTSPFPPSPSSATWAACWPPPACATSRSRRAPLGAAAAAAGLFAGHARTCSVRCGGVRCAARFRHVPSRAAAGPCSNAARKCLQMPSPPARPCACLVCAGPVQAGGAAPATPPVRHPQLCHVPRGEAPGFCQAGPLLAACGAVAMRSSGPSLCCTAEAPTWRCHHRARRSHPLLPVDVPGHACRRSWPPTRRCRSSWRGCCRLASAHGLFAELRCWQSGRRCSNEAGVLCGGVRLSVLHMPLHTHACTPAGQGGCRGGECGAAGAAAPAAGRARGGAAAGGPPPGAGRRCLPASWAQAAAFHLPAAALRLTAPGLLTLHLPSPL